MKIASRALAAIAVCMALFGFGGAVSAQTITQAGTNLELGIDDGQSVMGQSVLPPANRLNSFTFNVRRTTATLGLIPVVYEYTASGQPIPGAPLWTGAPVAITSLVSAPVTFITGGLTLDPTKRYALVVRQQFAGQEGGFNMNSVGAYADGGSLFGTPAAVLGCIPCAPVGSDAQFSAVFAPAVTAVPTLSEWAMIGLGLMLASGAALTLQRRQAVRVRA